MSGNLDAAPAHGRCPLTGYNVLSSTPGEMAGGGKPSKARFRRASRLKQIGVSEYAQRFAENGIDSSAIPHLTDQDPQGRR
jgi:SAM domain (Sterile alpha motif)